MIWGIVTLHRQQLVTNLLVAVFAFNVEGRLLLVQEQFVGNGHFYFHALLVFAVLYKAQF